MRRDLLLFLLVLVALCVDVGTARASRKRGRGRNYNRRRNDRNRHDGPMGSQTREERQRESQADRPWRTKHGDLGMGDVYDRFMARRGGGRHSHRRFGFEMGPFNMRFSFGGDSDQMWWKGPNVCTSVTEEPADGLDIRSPFQYHTTSCTYTQTAFQCTTMRRSRRELYQVTEMWECCDGHDRESGQYGCSEVELLTDIPTLLETLELDEFIKLMDASNLLAELGATDTNNFTVFAPTDDALNNMLGLVYDTNSGINLQRDFPSVVIVSQEINETVLSDTRNILLGHLAVGRLTSSHLQNNQILETASPTKATVRINTYEVPTQLMTANCVKITAADNKASNGVVHVTNEVLKPVTSTLLELIQKNQELRTIKTVLGALPLATTLKEDGQLTMLAPTDAAFQKHEYIMQTLLNRPDCLENVLKNHLMPEVICSSVVETQARARNSLGNIFTFTRDADDKMYVNGIQIIARDLMATNGVLYIIDDVIIPNEALGLLALAEKNELTDFVDLVDMSGLKKEIENSENLTMFVPSNEALQALSSEFTEQLKTDKEALARVLQYHLLPEVLPYRGWYNNMMLETVSGENLRVKEYSMFPFGNVWQRTIQCAQLKPEPIKGCSGIIYVVDKLLIPPVGNVLDILAQDPRLSTLAELFKASNLADTMQQNGPFTVFAPTNEAFEELGTDVANELKDNPEELREMLLNLVTADSVCCSAVLRANWFNQQKIRTLSGTTFPVHKTRRGITEVAGAEVIECDLSATNGIVHVINRVIMDESSPFSPWYNYGGMDHFGGMDDFFEHF